MRTGRFILAVLLLVSGGCSRKSVRVGDTTLLISAAARGDIEEVQSCLARGENVNETDGYRRAPLSGAVRYGNAELVELLLAHGADVNIRCDANGGTPLQVAVEQGWKPIVKLLLAHGAKVDARDKSGRTPGVVAMNLGHRRIVQMLAYQEGGTTIHVAAYLGAVDTVERLLKSGASPDAQDAEGQTPLQYAAREGHTGVVQLLLAKGSNPNGKGSSDTPLLDALWRYHTDVAGLLVKHGAQIEGKHSTSGQSPVRIAIEDNLTELVELMLAHGARVDARDNTGRLALHYARTKDMAQLLLSRGADVNAKDSSGVTPLHYAAGRGHADLVQLLIDNHAEIDPKDKHGQTPAAYAVRAGHKEIVQLLAAHGAALSLPMAAYVGDAQAVRRLLESGADVNLSDKEGGTPLYLAAQEGNLEVMELLIVRGADVKKGTGRDSREFAPLHAAASCGRTEAIGLLLRAGADANAKGQLSTRVLYEAAREGHRDAVAALVAAGAEINGADGSGRTPLFAAALQGHGEVVELLLEKGADATVGQMGRDITLADPHLQTVADMTRFILQAYAPYTIIVTDPVVVRRFLQGDRIRFDDVWVPTEADIQGLDVALKSSLEKGPPTRRGAWLEPDYVLRNLTRYNREFSGFVEDDVRYLICQMLFFGEIRQTPPQNAFTSVGGGGSGVLRVVFNAEKKSVVKIEGNPAY